MPGFAHMPANPPGLSGFRRQGSLREFSTLGLPSQTLLRAAALKPAWDRSLPPAVRETGRRSVGNRKERLKGVFLRVSRTDTILRLNALYSAKRSGVKGHCPLRGSGAESLSGVWGGNPNVPQGEAQRNAAEQPPEAALSAEAGRIEAGISENHRMNTQRPFPYL